MAETRLWLVALHPQWAMSATATGGEVLQWGVACRETEIPSRPPPPAPPPRPAMMETCWEGSEPSPKVAKYSNHEAGKVGGTGGGGGEGGLGCWVFKTSVLTEAGALSTVQG